MMEEEGEEMTFVVVGIKSAEQYYQSLAVLSLSFLKVVKNHCRMADTSALVAEGNLKNWFSVLVCSKMEH